MSISAQEIVTGFKAGSEVVKQLGGLEKELNLSTNEKKELFDVFKEDYVYFVTALSLVDGKISMDEIKSYTQLGNLLGMSSKEILEISQSANGEKLNNFLTMIPDSIKRIAAIKASLQARGLNENMETILNSVKNIFNISSFMVIGVDGDITDEEVTASLSFTALINDYLDK